MLANNLKLLTLLYLYFINVFDIFLLSMFLIQIFINSYTIIYFFV